MKKQHLFCIIIVGNNLYSADLFKLEPRKLLGITTLGSAATALCATAFVSWRTGSERNKRLIHAQQLFQRYGSLIESMKAVEDTFYDHEDAKTLAESINKVRVKIQEKIQSDTSFSSDDKIQEMIRGLQDISSSYGIGSQTKELQDTKHAHSRFRSAVYNFLKEQDWYNIDIDGIRAHKNLNYTATCILLACAGLCGVATISIF